jgi:hypothetical protein
MPQIPFSPWLFGAERDQYHWRTSSRDEARELQQHGDPGRVVLRAGRLRNSVEMRTDDQVWRERIQFGVGGDQIERRPGGHAYTPRHARRYTQRLSPNSQARLTKPRLHVVRRLRVGVRRRLPGTDVVGQRADVPQRRASVISRRDSGRRSWRLRRRERRRSRRRTRGCASRSRRGRRHRLPVGLAGRRPERGSRTRDQQPASLHPTSLTTAVNPGAAAPSTPPRDPAPADNPP